MKILKRGLLALLAVSALAAVPATQASAHTVRHPRFQFGYGAIYTLVPDCALPSCTWEVVGSVPSTGASLGSVTQTYATGAGGTIDLFFGLGERGQKVRGDLYLNGTFVKGKTHVSP